MQKQIPIARLILVLRQIQAIRSARLRGDQAGELNTLEVRAVCIQCGIALTMEEVGQLIAWDEKATSFQSARLERLQKGYCARRGCDSYFYDVTVGPDDLTEEEVEGLIIGNDAAPSEMSTSELPASAVMSSNPSRGGPALASIGIATVLCVLVWWHFRTPGWSTRSSGYQVDLLTLDPGTDP